MQRKNENFKKNIYKILNSSIRLAHAKNFIKKQLYIQWPNSKIILFNLVRNLGNEICLFNKRPILISALLKGTEFYRKRISLDLHSRDRSLFVYFFKNVIFTGSYIFNCYVKNLDTLNDWDYSLLPYLDWRSKNPGRIQVIWQDKEIDGYLRLCFLHTIIPKNFVTHCPWIISELEAEICKETKKRGKNDTIS